MPSNADQDNSKIGSPGSAELSPPDGEGVFDRQPQQDAHQTKMSEIKLFSPAMHLPGMPVTVRESGATKLCAAGEAARQFGEAWLRQKAEYIANLPRGTVIAINTVTGEHVDAADGLTAMDLFEARFGKGVLAWVHEVGVPISIGGGYWALFSEA